MPIRREHRHFYPIDWPQLSAFIRFARAKGCCEQCGRPHMQHVAHLGDGRWWDVAALVWRSRKGTALPRLRAPEAMQAARLRITFVVLATAHLDHDTSNNEPPQSRCALPALPHAPRPAGASEAQTHHAPRAQGHRRLVQRTICALVAVAIENPLRELKIDSFHDAIRLRHNFNDFLKMLNITKR